MLFNSLEFLIFFPVVTVLYFLLPYAARWALLLAASCVFYMAFIPKYIFILAFTITIDYFAGRLIEKLSGERKRVFLIVSLVSNIGILFVFKYFNFFNVNLTALAGSLHWNYSLPALSIMLPIGLSFHTFQSMSYIIEVYRGRQKVEKNFGIFALYVMFFPQLVAGPIERPQNLLHQFYEKHDFDYARVTSGLRQMAWGMFKKVAVADQLAFIVNRVYNDPREFSVGWPLIIATICFAFQVYCDFSGYSEIAIGAARVLGFRLMTNFDRPYSATSIAEFWKRWHISLSSWFRDYLYFPLGGNRVSRGRWIFNIMVVFLISGLWHGANWVFVIWGALHGIYLILENVGAPMWTAISKALGLNRRPRLKDLIARAVVFALVCFGWIFFRANRLDEALHIVGHLFIGLGDLTFVAVLGKGKLLSCLFAVALMQMVESLRSDERVRGVWVNCVALRWTAYYALLILMLFMGIYNNSLFIYFQF